MKIVPTKLFGVTVKLVSITGNELNKFMKIGIDLGGSKIEGLLLSDNGKELTRQRLATPSGDYNGTIDAIAELITNITKDHDVPTELPIGVGIPGTISRKTGLVKNANSNCLIGRQLDKALENRLQRRGRIGNDADCFTLSEATDGAGRASHLVFGVILGTGVGGASQ